MEMADSTHIMRACEEPGPWGGGRAVAGCGGGRCTAGDSG